MGRRAGSRNKEPSLKPKKPKRQKELPMYGYELGYNNHHITGGNIPALANQPKIVDKKSTKHFGILLSTQQSVEEFQAKSGMFKAFTTEYQFHYWALVARVRFDDEVLDIAVPTVMFNYTQEVNGAAVDFHLNDVEAASNNNAPIAEAIANVLVQSSFGQYLINTFKQVEWMNVPMNTCHVHPGNLSTFSGTDYAKTINDPGICFPLSEPQEQPSFSSIICHQTTDKNLAKIVRTEYRFATRDGLDINYLHGTCLSYWKGYTTPGYTIPGHKIKLPLITSIFSNKEFDIKEDVIVPEFVKPAYITTDGAPVVLEGNELLNGIIREFNAIDFSPYTEDITAERIVKMTHKSVYSNPHSYGNQSHWNRNEIPAVTGTIEPITGPITLVSLREKLIKAGYVPTTVYQWAWEKCKDMYERLLSAQKQVDATVAKLEANDEDTEKFTIDEMIVYLMANGFNAADIRGKGTDEIELMFVTLVEMLTEEEEAIESGNIAAAKEIDTDVDFKNNPRVRKFLNEHGLTDTHIDSLTNDAICTVLEDLNW